MFLLSVSIKEILEIMIKLCFTYVWLRGVKSRSLFSQVLSKSYVNLLHHLQKAGLLRQFDSLYINTLTKEGLIFDFLSEKCALLYKSGNYLYDLIWSYRTDILQ